MPTLKTLDEASAEYGVGRRTLQKWVSQGKLIAYKIEGDRKRYIDAEAVLRMRRPHPVARPGNAGTKEGGLPPTTTDRSSP